MSNDFAQAYLAAKSEEKNKVMLYLDHVDINDGYLHDAVLFSQIMYWHIPNKKNMSKMRVKHEGHYWIAKKHDDWYAECRVKAPMVRKALKRIEERNLIHYAVIGFGGKKTPIVRINWEGFQSAITAQYDTLYQANMIHCIESNTVTTSTETTKEKDSTVTSSGEQTDIEELRNKEHMKPEYTPCNSCGLPIGKDGLITDGMEELAICRKCHDGDTNYHTGDNHNVLCPGCWLSRDSDTCPECNAVFIPNADGICSNCGCHRQAITCPDCNELLLDGKCVMCVELPGDGELSDNGEQLTEVVNLDATPQATMAEVDAAIYGTRDNPVTATEAIGALCEVPTATPDAPKPTKTKKPRKLSYHQLLFGAISEALPGDPDKRTAPDKSLIGKAVKILKEVDAQPEEMKMLFYYCNTRYDNPGAMCMAKYYSAFKASDEYKQLQAHLKSPPEEVAIDDTDTITEVSEADKAEAARLLQELRSR
jgi:hypothetical protein